MSDNITIIDDDLRALLFWASVGVHLSKGGYCEEEIEHILESYAEYLSFTLPYPAKFAVERLPSFRGPDYVPPVRHSLIKMSNNIRFDKEDLALQDLPVENCTECDIEPATCYIEIDLRGAGFTTALGDGRYCRDCGEETLRRIQKTMPGRNEL